MISPHRVTHAAIYELMNNNCIILPAELEQYFYGYPAATYL